MTKSMIGAQRRNRVDIFLSFGRSASAGEPRPRPQRRAMARSACLDDAVSGRTERGYKVLQEHRIAAVEHQVETTDASRFQRRRRELSVEFMRLDRPGARWTRSPSSGSILAGMRKKMAPHRIPTEISMFARLIRSSAAV